nr:hypothetical protein [Providencia sp. PROV195]
MYLSLCRPETVYLIAGSSVALVISGALINVWPFSTKNGLATKPPLAGCFSPVPTISPSMRFSCASSLSKSVLSTDIFIDRVAISFLSDMTVSINEKATSG